jgi:uncharacterized protein (TIGR03067 family)
MNIGCYSLTIALLLGAGAWCHEAGTDAKLLEGKWTPTSAEIAGAKFPEAELKKISLQIADGKYTVEFGAAVDKGTVKIDAAAKPKAMDIVGTEGPNKGKTMLAIYEVKDDTLRICYDLTGKNRPTEFATSKEMPYFLAVYKRVK